MKLTPSQALEIQHELAAFVGSARGKAFFLAFHSKPSSVEAEAYRVFEMRTLQTAPTYLIAGDMMTLAQHATKTLPMAPLKAQDLPTESGFCVFDEAIVVPDIHGRNVVLAGFSWCIGADPQGIRRAGWSLYSRPTDSRDSYFDAEAMDEYQRQRGPDLLLLGNHVEELDGKELPHRLASKVPAEIMMRQLPLALWALMQQTLVVSSPERPERATRRRLEKAGSSLADKLVRVVKLRRVRESDGHDDTTPRTVEWTHRWIVSGHWREQACGTQWKDRKRIWVMPYVKGDAELPLVAKETVYVLAR